ncbi:MAG: ubiquinol-cytochrome c reductase iron-sulfur subunit [Chitinispirillaceae bacterium]|nr:ubiquinol-cytochrome c reductase iron-sulfur subunit [Chitinispirillaceae bacterium]
MQKNTFSRREFILTSGSSAIAAAIIGPMMVNVAAAKSKSVPMKPISLDLKDPGNAALTKVGGALKILDPGDKKRPIIVTRISETACAAFSSRCTHLGCEVSLPTNDVITCKCHKSKFDMSGKVTHGPAKKNLKTFTTTMEGAIITIREQLS